MAAAATDLFKKLGKNRFSTTLSASKTSGASSLSLTDATDLPTDTGVVLHVYSDDASGNPDTSTAVEYHGTLSGTTVSNLTVKDGTDQTHNAGANVIVSISADQWDDLVDGILQDHDQSGQHKTLTDTNGNEWIEQSATASAVNHVKVTNAATGNAAKVEATGSDTNVDLELAGKGTGSVTLPNDSVYPGALALVEDSAQTDSGVACSTSYTTIETLSLSIPSTWSTWDCFVTTGFSAATTDATQRPVTVQFSIDGTAQQEATFELSSSMKQHFSRQARQTGIATTGSVTVLVQGKFGANTFNASQRFLYARAIRTS